MAISALTIEQEQVAAQRVAALDWKRIDEDLAANGCAVLKDILSETQCAAISQSYSAGQLFRSRIVMASHGFGRGEYQYFAYPLPDQVAALRTALYAPLAEIANRWNADLGIDIRYPADLSRFLQRCHKA